MQDVADIVGVSRQLVSMIIRDEPGPSAETRQLVISAARDLGYRPNLAARLLRQRDTRRIGLIFSMHDPFQVGAAEQLFVRASSDGFGLVLGPIALNRPVGSVLDELLEARVDAIITFSLPLHERGVADAMRGIPAVLVGDRSDVAGVDNIHFDEVAGMRLAITHLTGLGHRDITYIGERSTRGGRNRSGTYVDAMRRAELAARIEVAHGDVPEERGAAAARELLGRGRRPTAIVAMDDRTAVGAMAVLLQARVLVPEEISIISLDDSHTAALSFHRLTSIRRGLDEIANAAWVAARTRLASPEAPRLRVAISATLVVRETTGRMRPPSSGFEDQRLFGTQTAKGAHRCS